MKKLIMLFLSVLFFFPEPPAKAGDCSFSPIIDGRGPIIHLTIELGRPKKGCTGFGICKFKVDFSSAPTPATANGRGWIENGKLNVEIDRNSIESNTFKTYFESGTFRMEEDFTLPDDAAAALGVSGYTIKSGNYIIRSAAKDANVLSMTF